MTPCWPASTWCAPRWSKRRHDRSGHFRPHDDRVRPADRQAPRCRRVGHVLRRAVGPADDRGVPARDARTFAGHTFATWPARDDIIAHAKPAARLEASAEWERLASALRYRDDTRPLIPQLRSAGLADATVATFLTIGGLGRWRSANDFRFEEMRAEFLEAFGDMRALPAVDRERLTAPVAPALPRGPAPLSQIAAPVAALHRPAPYSPGDPE